MANDDVGSLNDFLASMTEDESLDFLHEMISVLRDRADKLGLQALTEVELTVLVVHELKTAVMFDGYNSFIDGYRSPLVPYAAQALTRMGRQDLAAITQKAIDVLEIVGPITVQAIEAATDVDSAEASDSLLEKWDHCDELFYEHIGLLDDELWDYIKSNRQQIDLSPIASS